MKQNRINNASNLLNNFSVFSLDWNSAQAWKQIASETMRKEIKLVIWNWTKHRLWCQKDFFFRINRWWKTYENHPEIYLIKTRWLPNQGSFVVKLVNFHMVGAQSMPFFVTTKVIAFQFPKYSVLILF